MAMLATILKKQIRLPTRDDDDEEEEEEEDEDADSEDENYRGGVRDRANS